MRMESFSKISSDKTHPLLAGKLMIVNLMQTDLNRDFSSFNVFGAYLSVSSLCFECAHENNNS